VLISPLIFSPAAKDLKIRLIIFPLRVFGRESEIIIFSGFAIIPISLTTCFFKLSTNSEELSRLSLEKQKQL